MIEPGFGFDYPSPNLMSVITTIIVIWGYGSVNLSIFDIYHVLYTQFQGLIF